MHDQAGVEADSGTWRLRRTGSDWPQESQDRTGIGAAEDDQRDRQEAVEKEAVYSRRPEVQELSRTSVSSKEES